MRARSLPRSFLQSVARPEKPANDGDADCQEDERRAKTHHDADVRYLSKTPAEAADQVHDRVEQADGLPDGWQHVDGIEGPAKEGERRDD